MFQAKTYIDFLILSYFLALHEGTDFLFLLCQLLQCRVKLPLQVHDQNGILGLGIVRIWRTIGRHRQIVSPLEESLDDVMLLLEFIIKKFVLSFLHHNMLLNLIELLLQLNVLIVEVFRPHLGHSCWPHLLSVYLVFELLEHQSRVESDSPHRFGSVSSIPQQRMRWRRLTQ